MSEMESLLRFVRPNDSAPNSDLNNCLVAFRHLCVVWHVECRHSVCSPRIVDLLTNALPRYSRIRFSLLSGFNTYSMPASPYIHRLRQYVGHELLLIPSVTIIVFDERQRILLVRHSEGDVWVTPGGSIEPNESPADAAVREMWEETRLLVEPVRVLGVYGGPEFQITYTNGDRVTYLMTVFQCRILRGEMQPDGVETLEMAFVSQSEIAALKLAPWAQAVLPGIFQHQAGVHFQAPTWKPPAAG